MKHKLVEALGWYGAAAIITAYGLVSFQLLNPESTLYQLLNLTGALGIIADTYTKKDYQPLVLNIFWLAIAILALLRTFII